MASEDISLLEFIDLSQLSCLNESLEHSFKSIVALKRRNTSAAFLSSDADEQLLLNVPFNQAVRIRSIRIQCNSRSAGPKKLKLVINKKSVGFEDVEDAEEPAITQTLDLSQADVSEGKSVALRFVRFQSVNSLHIFVQSNQEGDDETRIDSIDIFGIPVETTKDLKGLRNQEE